MVLLRIAGVDNLSQTQPGLPEMQQAQALKPYTGALEIVDNASKTLSNNLTTEKNALQVRLGSLDAGLQAQSESIQAASKSASIVADTTAKLSGNNLLSGFAGAAAEGVKIWAGIQAEKQKQQQTQDEIKATQAIQDLKLEWQSRLYEEGVQPYRTALLDTLSKYNLAPDVMKGLMREGYSLADEFTKTTVSEQQKTIRDTREKLGEVTKYQLLLGLNADLSQIANNPYEDQSEAMKRVDQQIAQFLNQPGISELDKATALSAAYESVLKNVDTRNKSYTEIQQRLTALKSYVNEEAKINDAVRSGTMSPLEANSRKAYLRQELGVHPGYTDTDPLASDKFLSDQMKTQQEIHDLQEQRFIDAAKQTQMSDQSVAYLAWQIIKSPDLAVAIKNDKKFYATSGAQRAVEIADMYLKGKDKSAQLATKKAALVSQLYEADKGDVMWLINQARQGTVDPSVNKQLESIMLGVPLAEAMKKPLTAEQMAQIQNVMNNYKTTLGQQIQLVDQQLGDNAEVLQRYGFYGSKAEIERRMQGYKDQYNTEKNSYLNMMQQQKATPVPLGNKPPFEPGASRAAFATMTYGSKKVRLPLEAGSYSISGAYSEDRGDHAHAGVDLPAPVGTKILAPVSGTVKRIAEDPEGYGYYLDVLGKDGKLYRFAHMVQNSALVRVGSKVTAGQWIGRVGNTGRSSGAHLHFEVRDPNKPYGFDGTIDPLQYLSSIPNVATHNYPTPASNARFKNVQLPPDAFPLANGYFISGGKLRKVEGLTSKPVPGFSGSAPMRQSYVGKGDMRTATRGSANNHGYALLAQNPQMAKALNDAAHTLGVPGAWLADIIAFETGGRFSTSVDNGLGYVGLIQCGSECRADLGISYAQLANMSFAEQLKRVVVPHIQKQAQYAGTTIKGVEYLLAAVWGGGGLMRDLDRRGAAAITDPKNNDGWTTFANYLKRLGSHAGRQYQTMANRSERVTMVKHTSFRGNCPICNAMRQAGTFQPHEAPTR